MDYISVFILIFCFAVGITTYILALIFLYKDKNAVSRFFLVFLSLLTAMILIATVMNYLEPLLVKTSISYFILSLLSRLSTIAFAVSAVLLAHKLVNLFQSRRAYIIEVMIMAVLAVAAMSIYYYALVDEHLYTHALRGFDPSDLIVYPFILYPFLLTLVFLNRIENRILHKVVRTFSVTTLAGTPFIFLEDFNMFIRLGTGPSSSLTFHFLVFPLLYILVNVFMLYYGFKYLVVREGVKGALTAVSEPFMLRYGITLREKEITELLLEGLSNKEIGTRLFISPATVRNHLHNIFDKTGVASRIELLNLCQSFPG
jgi:DNA-binding CsgD family transcriptional regulator